MRTSTQDITMAHTVLQSTGMIECTTKRQLDNATVAYKCPKTGEKYMIYASGAVRRVPIHDGRPGLIYRLNRKREVTRVNADRQPPLWYHATEYIYFDTYLQAAYRVADCYTTRTQRFAEGYQC